MSTGQGWGYKRMCVKRRGWGETRCHISYSDTNKTNHTVNGHRKQLRIQSTNKLFSLSNLYWCSLKPATNDAGLSSQVFSRITKKKKKEIHLLNSNKPYGLTHELGSVPLCSLRDTPSSLKLSYATPYGLTHELGSVPLCSLRDTPSSLKLSYATVKLQFTKLRNFRNPLGRGKNPAWPPEWSHVQSMGRHGAPSLTNKLYTMDRVPLPGQGPNSPPDLALVGYLNLLAYQVQINFTIILQSTQ